MRASLFALGLMLGLAACQPARSYYAWNGYADSVWRTTFGEGVTDVGADIDTLNATIEGARASGQPIPPGMHAHLGMLYGERGEFDTAIAAFESEKELYPESSVFMDRLIAQTRGEDVGGDA